MSRKALPIVLAILGTAAVSYGMIRENHVVFVLGILFVFGAYLLIRKKLKASIRDGV
jgi:EamA domain-containing membrane protein RarD